MIGEIKVIAFDKRMKNHIECDGRAVHITDYPILFDLIGHKFGDNAPDRMFYLPNLPSIFPDVKVMIEVDGVAPQVI